MACVIYKGTEKLLVDPRAVDGMIAQGWSKEPQVESPPPSAEDFNRFMNMHEELKRVTDTALSLRDDQIHELVNMNEVLTEEVDTLAAANTELQERFEDVLSQLADLQRGNEKPDEPGKIAHKDYLRMKIDELRETAKRAMIPGYQSMKKQELIDALQLWELNGGSESTA